MSASMMQPVFNIVERQCTVVYSRLMCLTHTPAYISTDLHVSPSKHPQTGHNFPSQAKLSVAVLLLFISFLILILTFSPQVGNRRLPGTYKCLM